MRFFLIPRDEKFYDLLEQHALAILQGATLFKDLTENWQKSHPAIAMLRDLEHECDITTHEIMDKLNRTFITPIDREDIHVLAKALDDVIDIIQSISERMVLFGIERKSVDLVDLATILEEAASFVTKAVAGVRELKRSRRILDYCIEINRLENSGDRIAERAIGKLFHEERDPMEVIKWKEIYDSTEVAIDKCEDIANIIEGIVAKYG